MTKYLKNLALIMTIIAGIAAVIGLYAQYKENNPTLEIKNITKDKLTDLPRVEGLKAQFYYKDSLVHSLWKLNYEITNIGNKAIIGEGNNKNIIKESLTFHLPDNFKILELNLSQDSLPFELINVNNKIKLKFLQWKPNETLNLVLYVEQLSVNAIPTLKMNEREIENGIVNYTTLQNKIDKEQSLFDLLPRILQIILRWIGYIFFGLIILVMPIVWIGELVKYLKYKKWKSTDYWMYEEWIDENIKAGKIDLHYDPQKLPKQYWNDYPYLKPVFSDNEFGSFTLGAVIVFVLTLIPLLIMIKI